LQVGKRNFQELCLVRFPVLAEFRLLQGRDTTSGMT
jgi:hypothetical protein